jgi:hypothetical protein
MLQRLFHKKVNNTGERIMRSSLMTTIVFLFLFSSFSLSQNYGTGYRFGPKFHGGMVFGYNGGFGGQLNFTVSSFQSGFPLSARFGVGYTAVEPGKSDQARRVFINNATNGTPQERGWIWDLRFDMLFPVNILANTFVYLGPRYSMFTANFNYVGGNEDFDVTSNQFGLGAGVETQFPLVPSLLMVFGGGVDYFFEGTLKGHDTSYSPDGDDVNPREDYTYNDADDAVNQPKFMPRFMIGINYGF